MAKFIFCQFADVLGNYSADKIHHAKVQERSCLVDGKIEIRAMLRQ